MAAPAVLDDDNLLRCICELGDQQYLRAARLVSHRLRTFATTVIYARLSKMRLSKIYPARVEDVLNQIRGYQRFLNDKISRDPQTTAEANPAIYASRYENGLVNPMVMHEASASSIRMRRAVLFIDHLRRHGVVKPYVIITPDVAEWQQVIETSVPHIPLIVNEGSPAERGSKIMAPRPLMHDFILLSSYNIALRDTTNFAKIYRKWRLPGFVMFDHGHVELRRGWKKGSPTWKLYNVLTRRIIVGGVAEVPNHAFLGTVCDLSPAEVRFLFERTLSMVFDRLDEVKTAFVGPIRAFGIGKRDMPQVVDQLLTDIMGEVLFKDPRFVRILD